MNCGSLTEDHTLFTPQDHLIQCPGWTALSDWGASQYFCFTLILQCMAHGHICFMLLKTFHVTETHMSLGDFSMVLLIVNFICAVFLWYVGWYELHFIYCVEHLVQWICNIALGRYFLARIGIRLLIDCLIQKATLSYGVSYLSSSTQAFQPQLQMHWETLHQKTESSPKMVRLMHLLV